MLLGHSSIPSGNYGTAEDLAGSQALAVVSTADHFPSVPSFDASNVPNLLDLSVNKGKIVSLANVNTPSDRLAVIGDLGGVLQKMKEDNVCPTIKTFTLLAAVMRAEVGSESAVLATMDAYGVQPDLTFFNTLVLKRSKTLKLQSALICGFHPNINVYSTLINAAIKRLDDVYLTNILRDMRNRNVAPNEVVVRQLESAAQYPLNFDKLCRVEELDLIHNLELRELWLEGNPQHGAVESFSPTTDW